jgi:TM2 domain-containing membrane protein YozV
VKSVILIVLIFSSFLLKSQTAEQSLELANNAFQIGDYYSAKSAYTRAAYFTLDSHIKKHCYLQLAQIELEDQNIDGAVNRLRDAAFEEIDQSKKNRINLQRIKLIILKEDFKNANFEFLQLNIDSNSVEFIDYTLLKGMLALGLEDYESAKSSFAYLARTDEDKMKIYSLLDDMQKKFKKPLRARFLSTMLPGLGQIYVGDVKNALNSFVLVTGLSVLLYTTAVSYGFWQAMFAVAPWIQRYYFGGGVNASRLAEIKNRRIKSEHLQEVIAIISNDD